LAIEWTDVSVPMHPGMTVWPGDPPFSLSPLSRIAEGGEVNVSEIRLSTHCGTHCDAPWHFEEDGKRLDEIDPAVYFGQARIIEALHVDVVTAHDLGKEPLPQRILVKTRNSAMPIDQPFETNYAALSEDAARRCVDEGVRLVGVDYYSVAPYEQPGQPTHHILLQNEVFVVEGLRLAKFGAGVYWFTCLPMPIAGADGAPCRAFIGQEPNPLSQESFQ
jgi:arylformamidase